MTIKNILQHSGAGGMKSAFERYHHNTPMDHSYYPPPPYHGSPMRGHMYKHYSVSHSSGGGSGGGHKGTGSAAMSALTLLSFLFFLNILQQCLKEHMMAMNPQVAIMAAREEEPRLKNIEIKEPRQEQMDKNIPDSGIGNAYPTELSGGDEFERIKTKTSIIKRTLTNDEI